MSVKHDNSDAIVSDSLQHLELMSASGNIAPIHAEESEALTVASKSSRLAMLHDGYGFRLASGSSTPPAAFGGVDSPLPDRHGLGWPGKFFYFVPHGINFKFTGPSLAKSTVSRLIATPEEKKAREEKLCSAVRVILECLGEDPDREGLVRTPERYAQALMWMTRGYEERLAGMYGFYFEFLSNNLGNRCH